MTMETHFLFQQHRLQRAAAEPSHRPRAAEWVEVRAIVPPASRGFLLHGKSYSSPITMWY